MTSIADKVVLLTGGSRGIGPVIAAALAERGAHLALAARSEQGLQETARSLEKYSIRTMLLPVDLSDPAQHHQLVSRVLSEFGRIDILINNAGVESEGSYLKLPWQEIRDTIELNLVAPMALAHQVLPHMLENKQGHIVQIASMGAKNGTAFAATYCGTKAGLAEWTRAMRLELAGTGVRFSTLFPGYVTDEGMFARYQITPPPIIGSCTPQQVARALVTALEKNKIELTINSSPAVRLSYILNEISPTLGDKLARVGVDFQRSKIARLGKS